MIGRWVSSCEGVHRYCLSPHDKHSQPCGIGQGASVTSLLQALLLATWVRTGFWLMPGASDVLKLRLLPFDQVSLGDLALFSPLPRKVNGTRHLRRPHLPHHTLGLAIGCV